MASLRCCSLLGRRMRPSIIAAAQRQPQYKVRSAKRQLIAAPQPDSGPLMSRRSDRQLPPVKSLWTLWLRTAPIFAVITAVAALGIFNYQKLNSPVVSATLYSLRTSEVSQELLGDEIFFRDMFPWIWGEINQLHGRIDISYGVKGTKGQGLMRYKCARKSRHGYFETQEWSLELPDGRVVQLLHEGQNDPSQTAAMT